MKLQVLHLRIYLPLLLVFVHYKSISQPVDFVIDESEASYVVLQLEAFKDQDSVQYAQDIHSAVDEIRAIHSKLGYDLPPKKIISFTMDNAAGTTAYLLIRNFDNFKSAELYVADLKKEIDGKVYGEIEMPLPISHSNYKRCLAEKDFNQYYKYYTQIRP